MQLTEAVGVAPRLQLRLFYSGLTVNHELKAKCSERTDCPKKFSGRPYYLIVSKCEVAENRPRFRPYKVVSYIIFYYILYFFFLLFL